MRQDLQDKLHDQYPFLFMDKIPVWCEDGWYDLINLSCRAIDHAVDLIPDGLGKQIKFTQIKQKWGTLRLSINHYTPYINGVIDLAEQLSLITCELCGNKGSNTNINGRIQTLCSPHFTSLNTLIIK